MPAGNIKKSLPQTEVSQLLEQFRKIHKQIKRQKEKLREEFWKLANLLVTMRELIEQNPALHDQIGYRSMTDYINANDFGYHTTTIFDMMSCEEARRLVERKTKRFPALHEDYKKMPWGLLRTNSRLIIDNPKLSEIRFWVRAMNQVRDANTLRAIARERALQGGRPIVQDRKVRPETQPDYIDISRVEDPVVVVDALQNTDTIRLAISNPDESIREDAVHLLKVISDIVEADQDGNQSRLQSLAFVERKNELSLAVQSLRKALKRKYD